MAEDISALVDEFVQKVNARRHELLPPEDVPKFLRRPYPGDEHLHLDESDWSDWQILAADHAARIRELETRIGRTFPNPFLPSIRVRGRSGSSRTPGTNSFMS
jgi:hypothetical protein